MDRSVLFLEAIIKSRFDNYSELIKETEANYRKNTLEAMPYSKQEMDSFNKDEKNRILEWYAEDYSKFTEEFPELFRKIFCIGYYSLLEHYLHRICLFQYKKCNYQERVDNQKVKNIFQSKKYLKEVCNIDVSKLTEWNEIETINKIRNNLVHELGTFNDPSKIMSYIGNHKNIIELDNRNRIIIKEGFLLEESRLFISFLTNILKQL